MSPFLTVFLSFLLISFAGAVISYFVVVNESFGAQGGEMVQLATSHVPTQEDIDDLEQEKKQIMHDIVDMTGSW